MPDDDGRELHPRPLSGAAVEALAAYAARRRQQNQTVHQALERALKARAERLNPNPKEGQR